MTEHQAAMVREAAMVYAGAYGRRMAAEAAWKIIGGERDTIFRAARLADAAQYDLGRIIDAMTDRAAVTA